MVEIDLYLCTGTKQPKGILWVLVASSVVLLTSM